MDYPEFRRKTEPMEMQVRRYLSLAITPLVDAMRTPVDGLTDLEAAQQYLTKAMLLTRELTEIANDYYSDDNERGQRFLSLRKSA